MARDDEQLEKSIAVSEYASSTDGKRPAELFLSELKAEPKSELEKWKTRQTIPFIIESSKHMSLIHISIKKGSMGAHINNIALVKLIEECMKLNPRATRENLQGKRTFNDAVKFLQSWSPS